MNTPVCPVTTTDAMNAIVEAHLLIQAVRAAADLDVLTVLETQTVDPGELAARCAMTERGARRLLDALEAIGIAARVDATHYRASGQGWSRRAHVIFSFPSLTDTLRTGLPVRAGDTAAGAQALYPDLVGHLGALFGPTAAVAAELIAVPHGRVLDVGAGAAPWSIAVARREPTSHITAVDLADVLPTTRESVDRADLAEQFEVIAGDMFTLDLPDRYDLVILGNICHLFDATTNQRLLQRLRELLAPDGSLAIIDVVPTQNARHHRAQALYALGLLQRTSTGAIHNESEYRVWLSQAGLGDIEATTLSAAPPLTLLHAAPDDCKTHKRRPRFEVAGRSASTPSYVTPV